MRTLCSIDAMFWQPAPMQEAFGELPNWIMKTAIKIVFETEVAVKLKDHVCDSNAPCVALGREMQRYVWLRLVCKAWGLLFRDLTEESICYARILSPSPKEEGFYSSHMIAEGVSLGGRYRAHTPIETSSDKSVLRAYDYGGPDGCHGKTEVIIKITSRESPHENEKTVYTWLESSENDDNTIMPRLHYEGPYIMGFGAEKYRGLVLECLGPDLGRLRMECRAGRFTPKMTLAVAIQTVRIYEKLHSQGWLHTNAKAGNFAVGPDTPGRSNQIYMFDFEYSHRIELRPSRGVECNGWNEDFKSLNWDIGLTPSRRDDMEGLAYVFCFLERGSHPWAHEYDDELWRIKISTPTKKLFEGMDPVYFRYFDEVKALAWGEIPDYEGMIRRFSEVWERKGYGGTPGEIDWWDECKLRKKTDM